MFFCGTTSGSAINAEPVNPPKTFSGTKSCYIAVQVIKTLDSPYEVIVPFEVVIEQVEERSFLASFESGRIYASGETPDQAVAMMKDMVTGQLEHLNDIPVEKLGKIPLQQLSTLRSHIKRA